MWIHSTLGFFSLTHVPGKRGTMQLRARVRRDLDLILAHLSIIGANPDESEADRHERDAMQVVIFKPDADYRWRILFAERMIPLVLTVLTKTITYDNFKDEIARTPHQRDKLPELHAVWALTRQWQTREPLPASARQPYTGPRAIEATASGAKAVKGTGGQHSASTLPPGGAQRLKPRRSPRKEHRRRIIMDCAVCGEPGHHASHCPTLRRETGGFN